MASFKRGEVWWYKFYFAGELIRESSKSSSKTVAKAAEQQRRRELEAGFHNIREIRQQRIRCLNDIIDEYLVGYRLRYRSVSFAEHALGHVSRLLGGEMAVDINEASVLKYQEDRLREKAAPKTINEEVRFLLKILGDSGEIIRAHLRKKKQLKLAVRKRIGKAFDGDETERLIAAASRSRSPHMYPAFMLARNAGLRDTEIKTMTWAQVNLKAKTVQVGRAKSEAGEGRIVPLNSELYEALCAHRDWYIEKFGATKDEWYLFPWGKPRPSDPARHVTSLKTAWKNTRTRAEVKGRWHDNRHTLITELAESGAGDETILEIAGHVDRQMLRHYSHIRMTAKRTALEAAITGRRATSQKTGS
jgi:integrase